MRRCFWMWMALAAMARMETAALGDEILVADKVPGKNIFKPQPTLKEVIVLSEDRSVSYLGIEGEQLVRKTLFPYASRRVTVKRSAEADRAALIQKWETAVRVAEFERATGEPVRLLSPTVRYPLPTGLSPMEAPPKTTVGPEIYFGSDSTTAAKIQLSEISQIESLGADNAKVTWVSGKTSEERFLMAWTYDKGKGQAPLLIGYEPKTLAIKEFAVSSLKTIRLHAPGASGKYGGADGWRMWSTADGKFKTEARFVNAEDGKVHLQRRDGSSIRVEMSVLSTADQDFVRAALKSQNGPGKGL